MSNQLLFGDTVKVLKAYKNNWYYIQSLYDGYAGWVTGHGLTKISRQEATQSNTVLTGELVNTITVNDVPVHIPLGVSLTGLQNETGSAGPVQYHFSGTVINVLEDTRSLPERVTAFSHIFLNAPYQWGGKTIFGIDCSGFAQMVYKLMGMAIPRDARLQVRKGKKVKKLEDARPGDLAFFHDKEEVVHVGILLGPDRIIHASGKVKIDTIDAKGIVESITGKRTHKLHSIKRFF